MPRAHNRAADILDSLDELSDECEHVSVGMVMDAFGARTYGPAIMLPALLELTPLGAVPGVPTFLAVTIILIAAQRMVGRRRPWLPKLITNRQVSGESLAKASRKLRPISRFMDRYFHKRLKFMTRAPFAQITAAIVIVLCLTVPLLEVLPFASSVPMLAIAGFGLAVLVRDGVAMLVALAISFSALGMGLDYWDGGLSDTEAVDGMVDQEDVDSVKKSAEEAGQAAEEMGKELEAAADEAGDAASEVGAQIERAAEGAGKATTSALANE